MAQSKSGKAKAARKEKQAQEKSLTFRGVDLTFPGEFPEGAYVQIEIERALAEANPDTPVGSAPVIKLLIALIGQEQLEKVRFKLTAVDDFAELAEAILDEYGLSLGGSEASQAS